MDKQTAVWEQHSQLPGSLELAYLGDALYDLYVRKYLIRSGEHVRRLHNRAIKIVCAHAQAQALERIRDQLTEDESAVARRARNVHQTPSKNADLAEYHSATALEAVIGYLYIMGRQDRIDQIMQLILDNIKE